MNKITLKVCTYKEYDDIAQVHSCGKIALSPAARSHSVVTHGYVHTCDYDR